MSLKYKLVGNLEDAVPSRQLGPLIHSRFERLDDCARLVARVGAVIGPLFDCASLLHIYPLRIAASELEDALVRLQSAGFLASAYVGHSYRFAHAAYHEAIYESIPPAQRTELHGQVAAYLESRPQVNPLAWYGQLAFHYRRSQDRQRALLYTRRAGEYAAARFANAEAIRYFGQALALADEQAGQERWELLAAREALYDLIAQVEQQRADLEAMDRIAESLESAQLRALTRLRWGMYFARLRDHSRALGAVREAVKWSRQVGDLSTETRALLDWGYLLLNQGDFPRAADRFGRVLNLIPETASDSRSQRVRAEALHGEGTVAFLLCDYPAAQASFQRAAAIRRAHADWGGEAYSLNNLGRVAFARGDYETAQGYYQQALNLWSQVGSWHGQMGATHNLGTVAYALGDYATAQDLFDCNLTASRSVGDPNGEALALANLGMAYTAQRDYATAREHCTGALALFRRSGDKNRVGETLTYLAEALEGLGDTAGADAAHREALTIRLEIGQQAPANDNRAGLARLALIRDDLSTAQTQAETTLAWLADNDPTGIENPLLVYHTLANVLEKMGKREQAQEMQQRAYCLLMSRAQAISDPERCHSYLYEISLHREILKDAGARSTNIVGQSLQ